MNAADREALAAFGDKLDTLVRQGSAIQTLQDITPALEELAKVAPTLTKLAEGYDRAGWAGRVLGRLIKWVGIAAGAIAGSWGVWTIFVGDKP